VEVAQNDVNENRHKLISYDVRFDNILRDNLGVETANNEVPTMTIVSEVLDMIRNPDNQRMVDDRKVSTVSV